MIPSGYYRWDGTMTPELLDPADTAWGPSVIYLARPTREERIRQKKAARKAAKPRRIKPIK